MRSHRALPGALALAASAALAFAQPAARAQGAASAPAVAPAVASAATPADAPASGLYPSLPLRRDAAPEDLARTTVVWAVVLLAGAALVAHTVLRRKGLLGGALPRWGHGNDERLQRRASLALPPHASVHVLRWRDEDYLVASTSTQVTLLGRKPASGADGAAAQSPEAAQ